MCKSSFRALTIIASVLSLGAFIAAIFASVASSPARAEIVINGAGESYCEYRSFTNENGNDTPLFKWGPCSVWGKDKLLLEGYIVVDFREQMSPKSSCSGRPYCFGRDKEKPDATEFHRKNDARSFDIYTKSVINAISSHCAGKCQVVEYRGSPSIVDTLGGKCSVLRLQIINSDEEKKFMESTIPSGFGIANEDGVCRKNYMLFLTARFYSIETDIVAK